jgi:hypothetical protein
MPVLSNELVAYMSASAGHAGNPVKDDTSTIGGAIDTHSLLLVAQLSSSSRVEVVSDNSGDTGQLDIIGRDVSGNLVTATVFLSGTTPVAPVQVFERVLYVNSRIPTLGLQINGNVTFRVIGGGTTLATLFPYDGTTNQASSFFINATSNPSAIKIRYDKMFFRNNNGSALPLFGAKVTLTADPAARIRIGIAAAVNDTLTAANRLTAPAGITFVDDNVAQNVPGTDLAAGAAVGVWIEQNLPVNDTARKSTFTVQLDGTTT